MKKKFSILLRFTLGVVIIIFLLSKMNLGEVKRLLISIKPFPFLLAIFSFLVGMVLSTLRWKILSEVHGTKSSFLDLFKVYLASLFLGNILPSGGLDVVRAVYLSRASGKRSRSFASVMVDRLLGVFAIFCFIIFGFLLGIRELKPIRGVFIIFLFLLFGVISLLLTDKVHSLLNKIFTRVPLGDRALRLYDALFSYRSEPRTLILSFLISLLIQLSFVTAALFDAMALSFSLPFVSTIVYVTAINFLAMIPVTLSGLGIREGGFVLFFAPFIGKEGSLILSILYYLTGVTVSLLGGGILLLGKEKIRLDEGLNDSRD
jgi:hypothetical protein